MDVKEELILEEDIELKELRTACFRSDTNKRKKSAMTNTSCKRTRLELYCLLCQDYGHVISDDCTINATCFRCGIKGHVRRDCPDNNLDDISEIRTNEARSEDDEIEIVTDLMGQDIAIDQLPHEEFPSLHSTSTLPTSIPLVSAASLPKESNYNFIFIEVETIQASNSSQKQLTQIGCHYFRGQRSFFTSCHYFRGERSFFTAIKPKELNHYLDDFKKNGDLLQLLNMQKTDDGNFEFRKMFEIHEQDSPLCVEEYEALLSLNVFLGENCILFSLLENNIQIVLKRMNHYGLSTDCIKGFCTWQSFLAKIGEKHDFEFEDWYKEKLNKPVPENLNAGIVAKMVFESVMAKIDSPYVNSILIEASHAITISPNDEIQESDNPIEYLEICSSFRPAMPVMITMQRLETMDICDEEDNFGHTSEIFTEQIKKETAEKEHSAIECNLACTSIKMGFLKVCPKDNIFLSEKEIKMKVSLITGKHTEIFPINIPMDDVIQVLSHSHNNRQLLFIFVSSSATDKVRKSFNMNSVQMSIMNVAEKPMLITISIEKVTRELKIGIESHFGAKLKEIEPPEVYETLASTSSIDYCIPCDRKFKQKTALSNHFKSSAEHFKKSTQFFGIRIERFLNKMYELEQNLARKMASKAKEASSIEIVLEFVHTAILKDKPVVLKSGVTHTHDWHLFIKAADGGKCENYLEKVVVSLHKSYDSPMRSVNSPPFEIKESGYGSFTVPIDLYFKVDTQWHKQFRKKRVNYELILQPNKEVVSPSDPSYQQEVKRCHREKITIPGTVDEGFRRRLIKGGGKQITVPPRPGSSSSTSADRTPIKDREKETEDMLKDKERSFFSPWEKRRMKDYEERKVTKDRNRSLYRREEPSGRTPWSPSHAEMFHQRTENKDRQPRKSRSPDREWNGKSRSRGRDQR